MFHSFLYVYQRVTAKNTNQSFDSTIQSTKSCYLATRPRIIRNLAKVWISLDFNTRRMIWAAEMKDLPLHFIHFLVKSWCLRVETGENHQRRILAARFIMTRLKIRNLGWLSNKHGDIKQHEGRFRPTKTNVPSFMAAFSDPWERRMRFRQHHVVGFVHAVTWGTARKGTQVASAFWLYFIQCTAIYYRVLKGGGWTCLPSTL